MSRTDIKMINTNGEFDFAIDPLTKDLTLELSYDTDIMCSLFTDKRANESQVRESFKRRGWFGDTISSSEILIGSWLWLIEQARLTNKTVNSAVAYTKDCLQWMIDTNLCSSISVTGRKSDTDKLSITVKIYVKKNLVASYNISIWENSYYINKN